MDNPFDLILSEIRELKEKVSSLPLVAATTPPEIINTEELCKRLDISEPTAIKWRRKKLIPSIQVGSSVRYNWPAVVLVLERKTK